ncbi:hypothetical protein PSACC_02474 [Paramicrosporidium saccamoebae]|uniref:Uncharacterized protein n=1 Tax=Paramicrosporidium saccamoebae TaxID=1246581 RepID=A0A2H9TIZ6_9FUNG|nr:hypothetical protein PSACC_02474 [Paramicrosporidium saccamoebae]
MLACAGLAMAILSLTLLATSPILAIAPRAILIGGLVLGIILMFVTALGAVGATNDRNSPALVGYSLLMLAAIGVTIWGVSSVGMSMKDPEVEGYLDRVWMDSDNGTILQIESWGQCCGFHNYTDRIQEPCTKYAEEMGCYELMKGQYEESLTVMLVPATLLLVAECVGLALNLAVLWLVWREGRQAKLVGDRQPFDAWHKAVFQ